MQELILPLGVRYSGEVDLELFNVATEQVDMRWSSHNLILNAHLNYLFSGTSVFGGGFLSTTLFSRCKIGTSNQTPERTDTSLKGAVLATAGYTSLNPAGALAVGNPVSRSGYFVFPAGTGTGTIQELLLVTGSDSFPVARIVCPAIDKTPTHELRVTWTLSMSRAADSFLQVIPAGQRDGVTAITCTATINDAQLAQVWGANSISWTSYINALIGSSNAPSDLATDTLGTIKGTQVWVGPTTQTSVLAYTPGDFYREIRYGFEIGEGNGAIAELVPRLNNGMGGIARYTFDPPLDKINTYRLYLTLRVGAVNPS